MGEYVDIPWGGIVQVMLAGAFGLWAWVVKAMGSAHIKTIDNLALEVKELRHEFTHELRQLRHDLSSAAARIAVLEHSLQKNV